MNVRVTPLILCMVMGLLPLRILAADPTLDPDRFKDVASELRCPTCVGLSVLESDAPFSKQIKDEVANQLKAGKSNDEILVWFTERYGPWILRVPPKTGVNILAWAIPLGALLIGPVLLWFFVWRRRESIEVSEGVKPLSQLIADWEADLSRARQRNAGGAP
jgi:cytochrome c-type biogenesis protein CcmH